MNIVMDKIKASRPDLANSSLTAYHQNLKKIHKDVVGGDFEDLDFLHELESILAYLATKKPLTARNMLNSIIVAYQTLDTIHKPTLEHYIKMRDDGNTAYTEFVSLNQKSESQERNWLTLDEIKLVCESHRKHNYAFYTFLQLFLAYPTRNDYRSLLITNHQKIKKENKTRVRSEASDDEPNMIAKYNQGFYIILNQFKTQKRYGSIRIEIKPELNSILAKHLRMIGSDKYLFTNPKTGMGFTSTEFTIWVQSMFTDAYPNKKISTTLLRHIICSDRFAPVMKEQADLATTMGHSLQSQRSYVKF